MSQAFARENDDQWLEDIAPTLNALMAFLSRQNNGMRIDERKSFTDEHGKQVHVMSNGLSYTKASGKWEVIL